MTGFARGSDALVRGHSQRYYVDRGEGAPSDADPLTAIVDDMPPIFLARGAQDSYSSPGRFVEAATSAGVEVIIESHPGRHGWESIEDDEQQRIIGRALDFVQSHLSDGSLDG